MHQTRRSQAACCSQDVDVMNLCLTSTFIRTASSFLVTLLLIASMATLSHHICKTCRPAMRQFVAQGIRHTKRLTVPICPRVHVQRSSTTCSCSPQAEHQQTQQQASSPAAPNPTQQQINVNLPALIPVAALFVTAGAAHASGAVELHQLADLDAATAHKVELFLRPVFTLFTFLYIIRIPMTWYPSIDGTKLPWVIAYAPTEPILKATRNVIPLVGGVDVTPIVWVALISFFNEILLGPQGILMLIQRQTGAL